METIGTLVVSTTVGAIEGIIDDCLIDLENKSVLGWSFRREKFFSSLGYVPNDKGIIGQDVLLTSDVEELPNEIDGWFCWGNDLVKNEVIDRLGRNVSSVQDLILSDDRTTIVALSLTNGLLLALEDNVSLRKSVVVIPQDYQLQSEHHSKEDASWWTRFWESIQ